jgi:hypothetical protein
MKSRSMALFDFEWFKCRDGYRVEERSPRRSKTLALDDPGSFVVVPNSSSWMSYRRLDVPAPYRAFANWDSLDKKHGPQKALKDLADAYGSMLKPKAKEESAVDILSYVLGLRNLVSDIDSAKWESIANRLKAYTQGERGPRPGIGRLGVVFEVIDGRPSFKLRPPTLIDALRAQALFDATHGVEHRKCANPECDRWFPISGENAYRVDAQYHSQECRLRHAYLIRKKKERCK